MPAVGRYDTQGVVQRFVYPTTEKVGLNVRRLRIANFNGGLLAGELPQEVP
jgi:hypothetical protein